MPRIPMTTHQLRAFAPGKGIVPGKATPQAALQNLLIANNQDARRTTRRIFGRSISMDRIELSLRAAYRGSMRDITDLSRETIDTDPHLASVLNKRFGALSSLPWEVMPASGYGIDPEKARYYAQVVNEQLRSMRNFRRSLLQLAWGLFDGRAAIELQWVNLAKGMADKKYGRVTMAVEGTDWIHPRRLSFGPTREMRVTDEVFEYLGNFSTYGLALREVPYKFIFWTPQLFGEYPEREGLAPRCLYWSFFKRFGARERMILMELFGKPWRIVEVGEDFEGTEDDLIDNDRRIDNLGGSFTARLARGLELKVVQPQRTAGQVHDAVITESDKQISKLVLGQTATTDAAPAGMNNNTASVMQDEQLMILTRDARELSEVIEDQLTDIIIALNFGPEEVTHAPQFLLRSDLPTDRKQEIERLQLALNAGIAVSLHQAYEMSGLRQPTEAEPVLRIEQPPTPPDSPVAPAARPIVVWPTDKSPAAGEQQPSPRTAGQAPGGPGTPAAPAGAANADKTVTVNEDRAARGLPPLALPDSGTPDPDGDLTIAEFGAKRAKTAAAAKAAVNALPTGEEEPDEDGDGLDDTIEPDGNLNSGQAQVSAEQATLLLGMQLACEHVQLTSNHKQPSTENGSPETILDRAAVEARPVMSKLAAKLIDAVDGLETVGEIHGALTRARNTMDVRPLARGLERRMVHGAALGALDAALLDDETIKAALKPLDFARLPFSDALRVFRARGVLQRHLFDKLEAKSKVKAFTAAGVTADQMLATVHDELAKQVAAGASMREFGKAIATRLKDSGFVAHLRPLADGTQALSAPHVETVFRTNVLSAYNAGRHTQMTDPEVLRRRPVWEIRGVNQPQNPDGTGTRPNHLAAHGKKLLASDPFFKKAYPPFGFNCRCRVVSHPASAIDDVVSGSTISDLPDDGFASGINEF